MVRGEHRRSGRRSSSLAQLERDAALGRIGRTRRWMIVTATALTAGFAAVVSAAVPGKSLAARATTSTPRSVPMPARTSSPAKMPPLASASQLGLQGPSQAPGSGSAQPQPSSDQGSAQAQQAQLAQQQAQQQAQASAPAPSAAPAPAVVSGGS